MRVHVVCRLNQARSIIASAALRKIYPNLKIYSSGISAQNGGPIPKITLEIAERWGLTNLDHSSTLFQSEEPILKGDLVICADDSIFQNLFKFDLNCKLVNVLDYVLADFLVPSDPVSLPFSEVEVELAKMVVATNKALQANQAEEKKIPALIYAQGEESTAARFINSWLESNQGIAIDMNWRIPDASIWERFDIKTAFFNPRFPTQLNQFTAGSLYCSDFEIDNQLDLITKPEWLNFLESLEVPKLLIIGASEGYSDLAPGQIISLLHANKLDFQFS